MFLQGIAAGIGTSNFLRAALIDCELELFIAWFDEVFSSQFSDIIEFWFLDGPSLFCFLLAASDMHVHISGHMPSGREVFCFLVGFLLDHVYPSSGLSFSKMNLVKPVHASDNSSPSTFQ